MQWVTPRNAMSPYVSESSDGYYRVSHAEQNVGQGAGQHVALYVEAVWARPVEIGRAASINGAQAICEQHMRRPVASSR